MTEKIKWTFDPAHTEIAFIAKHLMISSVKGLFKEYDAKIYTVGDDFSTAEIDLWMNPASVATGDDKRDQHLMSADFFNVENHRKIYFKSTSVKQADTKNRYLLTGDLIIKGIKKQVRLDVEFGGIITDPWGKERAGFSLNGKINRRDWDLNWNVVLQAGGVMVSEEIRIACEVQMIKSS